MKSKYLRDTAHPLCCSRYLSTRLYLPPNQPCSEESLSKLSTKYYFYEEEIDPKGPPKQTLVFLQFGKKIVARKIELTIAHAYLVSHENSFDVLICN